MASVGILGRGRVGRALAAALREAGYAVDGPAGRGEVPAGEAILLCVPDAEIPAAAAAVAGAARFVGHTSGATPLGSLDFALHPLQTITGPDSELADCGAAIAGATPEALALARSLAERLGMLPFEVRDEQRAAYHAAASMASNYLLALEWSAEQLAAAAGVDAPFAPLVRTTVENWARAGAGAALTGPIARGDEATVAAQRDAVARVDAGLLPLFDALADRTRALAATT